MTGVNMYFDSTLRRVNEDILRQDLTKIASVITSIDSIESRGIHLFKMVYNNNNTNHGNGNSRESQHLKEIMAKTRIFVNNTLVVIIIHMCYGEN
jgi:hypothetical protein